MKKVNVNLTGLWEQSYDPALLGKMKADTYNAVIGDLTGHDCPDCLNKGSVAFYRADGSIFTRQCACMKIRRCVWEMEKSGLKNSIRELTFDAFSVKAPWQKAIKQGAMEYAKAMDGWLLYCGQSGSGKTHLCTAVCRQRLLSGDEVRYMSWREKVCQVKAAAFDSEARQRLLEGYKNANILYIDDLYKGSETPTAADIAIAFEILNYRYINRLCTIISTERTPQELVDIDEATGSRIIEMAGKHVYDIEKNPARNWRLRSVCKI